MEKHGKNIVNCCISFYMIHVVINYGIIIIKKILILEWMVPIKKTFFIRISLSIINIFFLLQSVSHYYWQRHRQASSRPARSARRSAPKRTSMARPSSVSPSPSHSNSSSGWALGLVLVSINNVQCKINNRYLDIRGTPLLCGLVGAFFHAPRNSVNGLPEVVLSIGPGYLRKAHLSRPKRPVTHRT